MFYQIISLILEVVTGLITGACLLRLYMQHQRIALSAHSGNPMGPFIFALTDWLVLPLRRLLPAMGRWDTASLLGAFLLQLGQFGLLWVLGGMGASLVSVLILAVCGLLRMSITGLSVLVIVYALLSWLQTQAYWADLLQRLVAPLLAPIRKRLPLVGGVDLSPLGLLLLLQIAALVLAQVQVQLLLLSQNLSLG